ncbi:nuclear transport factor 2 family protein [Rufibacter quisquiliarum]|uniref:Ketosteroid isomerase-like protein n=1 Tax=Rufibacter quisquiliarum TaxID=1549639 RepID=A0A839GFR3_9BACT|nr:nuclear transport factor 2 family protein [Rufibacter quisquiliarum]MBA9075509.1 ketosteroid isomerase-like protein [Rufibacter quisquiliarum]
MKKELVTQYIQAYNNFDVEGMLANLHDEIVFKNVSSGEVNLQLLGLSAFKAQAEQAKSFFSQREQKITSLEESADKVEVNIAYSGVLAVDLPDGPQAGERLEMEGKSIFGFRDGKIISIEDIS